MKKDTIWNALFVQLLAFELLSQLGKALVDPIASNYAVALGATVAIGGFVAGLSPLTSLIFRPFGGIIFGLAKRKTLLLVASCIFALSSILCAAIPTVFSLEASRVLVGIAYAVKSSLVVALAAIVVPRSCIGQGVAIVGLSNIVAGAIGPSIASAVGLAFGYQVSCICSLVLFVASVLLLIALKIPESPNAENAGQGSVSERFAAMRRNGIRSLIYFKALPFMVLSFFSSYLYGTVTLLLLLVGEARGIEGISLFFFAYAITSCLARPIAGKLNDKYSLDKIIYPEVALMCLACLTMAFANSLPAFIVAAVLFAAGQGCFFPSLQAECVRVAGDEHSSLAINTFFIGADLGMAVGPIVSGAIMDYLGSTAMFSGCFVVSIASIVFFFFFDRYRKKHA